MTNLKTKLIPVTLLILLVFLQYRLWFEDGGIIDMYRMKQQLALEIAQNDKMKKRNERLKQQVQYLQNSNAPMEAKARSELGMIKKGETFYQVVN